MNAPAAALLLAIPLLATAESVTLELGNPSLVRHIQLRPHLRTLAIENRLSGHRFPVESEEFGIHLAGRALPLTTRDFEVVGAPVVEVEAGGQTLRVPLRERGGDLGIEVVYRLGKDDFWTDKRLAIRSPSRRVDVVEVERLRFPGLSLPTPPPTPQPLGWPIFVGNELFLGVAFPAAHNELGPEGRVALRHHPGRSGAITSKTAILGVAPDRVNDRVRDRFFAWLDRARARPVQRYRLWDTYFNDSDEQVRERFAAARRVFRASEPPLGLDAVVVDGGWTDPRSVMKVSPERPDRLELVRSLARDQLGSAIGLHVITSGGRATVDHAWLRERYDMLNEVSYCLADPRVGREQERTLLALATSLGVAAFKFDWANFNCDRGNHRGHRAGLDYGREAIADAYIATLARLRAARPDILLYDAGWDSPFWLLHEDLVFSGDGDFNTTLEGPPSLHDEDLESTWRDSVLARNFRDREVPFPLSSLMNHGPVLWGWSDWGNRPKSPPDRFADLLLMNYLRGTQLIEYYLNLDALDDGNRAVLASIARWAEANDDVLLADARFLLGDPHRGEIYGYGHFHADGRGIVGVRNPVLRPGTARLRLDEALGMRADAGRVLVSIVYPRLETFPRTYAYGDDLDLSLGAFETQVLAFTPERGLAVPLPLGVRYRITGATAHATDLTVLEAGTEDAPVAWSDGARRTARATPGTASPLPRPVAMVEAAPPRASDASQISVSFRFDRPVDARARLVAIQAVERIDQQPRVSIAFRHGSREIASSRRQNSARAPDRPDGPGWVMADTWLESGGSYEVVVASAPDPRSSAFLAALPFDCAAACAPESGRRLPFELWMLIEQPFGAGDTFELAHAAEGHLPPWGLPDFAHGLERRALEIATVAEGVQAAPVPRGVFPMTAGARPWSDRDYRIRRVRPELEGMPYIQLGHERSKRDASLAFRARVPLRVHAAFGPPGAADQWLDPQPGFRLALRDGFESDIPDVLGDIYVAEFPAGELRLFPGQQGNWILLGIAAVASASPEAGTLP